MPWIERRKKTHEMHGCHLPSEYTQNTTDCCAKAYSWEKRCRMLCFNSMFCGSMISTEGSKLLELKRTHLCNVHILIEVVIQNASMRKQDLESRFSSPRNQCSLRHCFLAAFCFWLQSFLFHPLFVSGCAGFLSATLLKLENPSASHGCL